MVNVFDVDASKFIVALTEQVKTMESIKPAEWSNIVKSSRHTERPPTQPDFWFIRTASILRSLYVHGPKGVQRLRMKYGGRKNRGSMPEKTYRGGGKIIRTILQQLEKEELVVKIMRSGRKGRQLTPKAVKLMDNVAYEVHKDGKK